MNQNHNIQINVHCSTEKTLISTMCHTNGTAITETRELRTPEFITNSNCTWYYNFFHSGEWCFSGQQEEESSSSRNVYKKKNSSYTPTSFFSFLASFLTWYSPASASSFCAMGEFRPDRIGLCDPYKTCLSDPSRNNRRETMEVRVRNSLQNWHGYPQSRW